MGHASSLDFEEFNRDSISVQVYIKCYTYRDSGDCLLCLSMCSTNTKMGGIIILQVFKA